MKIGYARTSTVRQEAGLMAQLRQLLEREGCEEVFSEQVSSVEHRGQLDAALSDTGGARKVGPVNLLPQVYAAVGSTKLSATLEVGKNKDVNFDLKGK